MFHSLTFGSSSFRGNANFLSKTLRAPPEIPACYAQGNVCVWGGGTRPLREDQANRLQATPELERNDANCEKTSQELFYQG